MKAAREQHPGLRVSRREQMQEPEAVQGSRSYPPDISHPGNYLGSDHKCKPYKTPTTDRATATCSARSLRNRHRDRRAG